MNPDYESRIKIKAKSANEASPTLKTGQIAETREAIRKAASRISGPTAWRKRK